MTIKGRSVVNTQAGNKSGFANNLTMQLVVLAIVVVGILALAWKYLW